MGLAEVAGTGTGTWGRLGAAGNDSFPLSSMKRDVTLLDYA